MTTVEQLLSFSGSERVEQCHSKLTLIGTSTKECHRCKVFGCTDSTAFSPVIVGGNRVGGEEQVFELLKRIDY